MVLADQFRDGNVPAMMEPLRVAKAAFAALPGTLKTYCYRGDSACHESGLVNRLREWTDTSPNPCGGVIPDT